MPGKTKHVRLELANVAAAEADIHATTDMQSFRLGAGLALDFLRTLTREQLHAAVKSDAPLRSVIVRGQFAEDRPSVATEPVVKSHLALVSVNGRTL